LPLLVQHIERLLQTQAKIQRTKAHFDLRVISGELRPNVANIQQVYFAHSIR